jgi:hypothetical protein
LIDFRTTPGGLARGRTDRSLARRGAAEDRAGRRLGGDARGRARGEHRAGGDRADGDHWLLERIRFFLRESEESADARAAVRSEVARKRGGDAREATATTTATRVVSTTTTTTTRERAIERAGADGGAPASMSCDRSVARETTNVSTQARYFIGAQRAQHLRLQYTYCTLGVTKIYFGKIF